MHDEDDNAYCDDDEGALDEDNKKVVLIGLAVRELHLMSWILKY